MKKKVLLSVMAVLFTVVYARAEWHPVKYRMDEPVKITLRGINFFVFPNGDFDFKVRKNHRYNHRRHRVRIKRDAYGRIRKVGGVSINYNKFGQVKRIGKLPVRYNRRGLVARIGDLKLNYRRNGYVVTPWKHAMYPSASFTYYKPFRNHRGVRNTYSTLYTENYAYYNDAGHHSYRSPIDRKKALPKHKKPK